ncbi:MAG: hypothetical protein ACI85I_002803 [Arenicella sp.]|jgi:hypothetical protein
MMKLLIFICQYALLIIFAFPAFSQTKDFKPTILNFPNLNPTYLAKFEKEKLEYKKALQTERSLLTEHQKELLNRENFYEAGPFFTTNYGCSWYCLGEPTETSSSSFLESNERYKSKNIHDFDLKTAWVEGNEDYGIGENITITFEFSPGKTKITTMDIFNGYCKSEKLWEENSRVKKLAFYANWKLIGNLLLEDVYKKQRFKVGSLGGDKKHKLVLSFKIVEVYKGDKYKDVAISEINFNGTGDH